MLDLDDFIKERGGDPEKIKESQRRRHESVELVDEIIALWQSARKANYEVDQTNTEINAVQKQIGQKKKAKEDAEDLVRKKTELQKQKEAQEEIAAGKRESLQKQARLIGNYVHASVPVSNDEANNEVVRSWAPEGFDPKRKVPLSHHEVLYKLGAVDFQRGVKLIGHRGYCLIGMGVFLNMALINYGISFLFERGYTPNEPPYFLNRDQMEKTAQLSQFDEELYSVSESTSGSDKYLIATSEQPISCMHAEEWLQPSQLPVRYAGYSTCFRKEAGGHGRDAWGLFRTHSFQKVEQFIFCAPDDSWKHFDEMIATSEEFYKSLGLPYQVVDIVSGALNNAASKKQDLEAYFPFQGEYKELVSCSNCTDYQMRELEIRYGVKKGKNLLGAATGNKVYVQALNATLCATGRTLCALLENFQTDEGVIIPEVLRKFIPGEPSFLPFVLEKPGKDMVLPIREKKKEES